MGTKFQLEVWNKIKKTTKDEALYYKYITKESTNQLLAEQ